MSFYFFNLSAVNQNTYKETLKQIISENKIIYKHTGTRALCPKRYMDTHTHTPSGDKRHHMSQK